MMRCTVIVELPDGTTVGDTFLVRTTDPEHWQSEMRTATELLQIAAARTHRKEHHHG